MTDDPLSRRNFGRHIRSLRMARGMTQATLAQKSGVAVETISRLEAGRFSPSHDTLTKVVETGMNLPLSTMFRSCEPEPTASVREAAQLLTSRSRQDLDLASRFLRSLFDELDARKLNAAPEQGEPDGDD